MAEPGKKTLRGFRRLEKAQALISGRIETALKSAGLPPLVWLRLFDELARAKTGALRPFELQRALGLEQPAVSRLLDKMATAGELARQEARTIAADGPSPRPRRGARRMRA